MSSVPQKTALTKAEFEAGLQALEERLTERLTERLERMLFLKQANDAFAEFDRIGETRDTNPHGYTEEDVPRLVKEVRAEMAAERAAGKDIR